MGDNRSGFGGLLQTMDYLPPRNFGGDDFEGSVNLLALVSDEKSAKSSDELARGDRAVEQKPLDTSSVKETREIILGIQQKMQELSALYDKQPDGSMKLKPGKISDGKGGQIEVAEAHAALIAVLSKEFERAITKAEHGVVPQLEAHTVGARRDFDKQVESNRMVESQLAAKGINLKDANGFITTAAIENYVKANPTLAIAERNKLEELKTGISRQQELEKTLNDYRLLRMGPIICHNEYARFLKDINLPNAAAQHVQKAEAWADERSRPAELARVSAEVKAEQEKRLSPVIEKYIKSADNPFASITKAHELAGKGDKAGARAALEEACTKAGRLSITDIEADLKKYTEDAQKELKGLQELLQGKQRLGVITPADVLKATEREAQLNNGLAILQSFLLAKPKADLAFASFLLTEDTNAGSEPNRSRALEMLLKNRYDKYGKIAAAQESEMFDKLLEKAMSGPSDNQARLLAFQESMKKYDQLKKEALGLNNNDQIAAKLKEAREQADTAKGIAQGIDRALANRSQQTIRTQLYSKIAEEQSKPAGQRDNGKITLLQEITKPSYRQDRDIQGLINEAFKEPKDQDKAKIARLEGMVKSKEELSDILAAHAELTRLEFMKQAVNQARVAVIELDVMFDKAENHSYTGEIERDPFGWEFRQGLGQTGDGKNIWNEIKNATRDLAWYETAWKWFKGSIKDILIAVAAGVSGFVVGTLVGGLSIWSGPGAVIAGGAAGFATGAAVGTGLHAAFGDKITPMGVIMNGIDGMSGGLMGAGRSVALRSGAVALETLTGKAVATQGVKLTAGETYAAFRAAGVADKIRIVAGTRFGATMTGATLSSVSYRFGHEGVNFYAGKYDNFKDYALSAGGMALADVPGNIIGTAFGLGFDKLMALRSGAPMVPSRLGFSEYFFAGPLNTQLGGKGYYRPPTVPSDAQKQLEQKK